jgi:heme/copper-type cytochrome/quinol oxidase subunit 3
MSDALSRLGPLPVGYEDRNSVGWWGAATLIATEASLFAYLLFSYYYMALQKAPAWSPEPHPSLSLSGPNTVILLLSSAAVWWGERGVKRGRRAQQLIGLGLAVLLGCVFLAVQGLEWKAKHYTLQSGSYGSLFFTVTGFHMAHVAVGVMVLAVVWAWSAAGCFTPRRHQSVSLAALYWHFVDVVWLFVFSTFYLSPYVLGGGA